MPPYADFHVTCRCRHVRYASLLPAQRYGARAQHCRSARYHSASMIAVTDDTLCQMIYDFIMLPLRYFLANITLRQHGNTCFRCRRFSTPAFISPLLFCRHFQCHASFTTLCLFFFDDATREIIRRGDEMAEEMLEIAAGADDACRLRCAALLPRAYAPMLMLLRASAMLVAISPLFA